MTYYELCISTWDSSDTPNMHYRPAKILPYVINTIPTATVTRIVAAFKRDALRIKPPTENNLTLFMMQHSKEAFAEIWNDPEEDIWDEL